MEQSKAALLFVFGKCLLRILATKSTTAVDYFVVFISFTVQMTEEVLKLVKCCFLFASYAVFLILRITNQRPSSFSYATSKLYERRVVPCRVTFSFYVPSNNCFFLPTQKQNISGVSFISLLVFPFAHTKVIPLFSLA